MFRESLDQDTGMLFEFEENGEKYFHMKYKIFKSYEIKHIQYLCLQDAMFALEVNRGWFPKNNVRKIKF